MAIAITNQKVQRRDNLSTTQRHQIGADSSCTFCGGYHLTQDHQRFMTESMPQDPLEMIDDLIKMGVYKPPAIAVANAINQADLRKALFLKIAGRGDQKRERLINDLAGIAGGLDQAFAAAFGGKSEEFFKDSLRFSGSTRRQFLRNMAVGAALMTLSNCSRPPEVSNVAGEAEAFDTSNLEKTNLRIGFIPITCATPIIMSEPLGFYEKYGLKTEVIKMPSWAAVRDSAIAGELDAYHMLAPMPIAMTLGLGSATFPVKLASIENINGQAITIANKHRDKVRGPADFKGFTIGVPFPYSMHNLLLRYYLATGGLDPDVDVSIESVPPPDSVARLAVGDLDAMLMPDPFNQRAVYEEAGFIHILTKDLWPGHPCCAFAASEEWIDTNPNTFRAVNKAIIDGASYASKQENRQEIAKAISERQFLNQPEEVVAAVLTGEFEDGLGNTQNIPDRIDFDPYPWQSFANWISGQMVRWDFLPEEQANYNEIGEEIFMTDLARELSQELGQTPPEEEFRIESLQFGDFDPDKTKEYVEEQISQYGV